MFDCFAACGYAGRVIEINFGSCTILVADTGAGAAGAGAEGGGVGGLDVRPADVSNPAGGVSATASVEAISVGIGAVPSPILASF